MLNFKQFMESYPPDPGSVPQEIIRTFVPDIINDLRNAMGPEIAYSPSDDEPRLRERIKALLQAEEKTNLFLTVFGDAQVERADSAEFHKILNDTGKELKKIFRSLKRPNTLTIDPKDRSTKINQAWWLDGIFSLIRTFETMLRKNWVAPSNARRNLFGDTSVAPANLCCMVTGTAPFSAFFSPSEIFTKENGEPIDLNSEITSYEIKIPLLPAAIALASKFQTSLKSALFLQYKYHKIAPINYMDMQNMQIAISRKQNKGDITGPNIIIPSPNSNKCQKIKSPKYNQLFSGSNPREPRPNPKRQRRKDREELERQSPLTYDARTVWDEDNIHRWGPVMPSLIDHREPGVFFGKANYYSGDSIAMEIYKFMEKNWRKRIRIDAASDEEKMNILMNAINDYRIAERAGFVRYENTVSTDSPIYKNTVQLLQTPNRCWSIFEDIMDE